MDIIIKLTKEQLDIVMKGLSELPLKESLSVFEEINNQFLAQTQKKETE